MAFVTPDTHYAVVGLLTNNHPAGFLSDNTPNTMIISTLYYSHARFYFNFHRALSGPRL